MIQETELSNYVGKNSFQKYYMNMIYCNMFFYKIKIKMFISAFFILITTLIFFYFIAIKDCLQ